MEPYCWTAFNCKLLFTANTNSTSCLATLTNLVISDGNGSVAGGGAGGPGGLRGEGAYCSVPSAIPGSICKLCPAFWLIL